MSLALSGADAAHLAAAGGLTYVLGFERAIRGAPPATGLAPEPARVPSWRRPAGAAAT